MTMQVPDMTPRYRVDAIEFRDAFVVINWTDEDGLKGRFVQEHKVWTVFPGDEDIDRQVAQIHEDICELIDIGYVAKRNPPETRPSGLGRS